MSAHRDLKNAQQALNEAVRAWYVQHRWLSIDRRPAANALALAWQTYDAECDRLGEAGGSSGRFTSINAAHANLPRKGTLRWNILLCVVAQQAQFGTGMTVAELKARLKKEHSSVSSAINALYERDWLRDSGDKRLTQHGEPAIVWAPTDKAIAKCREMALEVSP